MKIELNRDWSAFLSALIARRVRFVLVGGHAVAGHGEPRLTEDLDVFADPTLANAKRLRDALVDLGFGEFALLAEQLGEPDKVFMLGRKPRRIDILTGIDGVSFKEACDRPAQPSRRIASRSVAPLYPAHSLHARPRPCRTCTVRKHPTGCVVRSGIEEIPMAKKSNEDVIRELYRAIEQGDMQTIDRLGGDAPFENVAFGETPTLREDSEQIKRAFPDIRIEVRSVAERGDMLIVEGVGRGTHQGALKSPTGDIAPTGRKVEVRFVDVYELSNGRVKAGRFYVDGLGMLAQLGIRELPMKRAA